VSEDTAPAYGAPNGAGVYDFLLGGRDNTTADRDLAAKLTAEGYAGLPDLVRAHRRFVLKSVTWLASLGIAQFVDGGCGKPSGPSVHVTARAALPGARVAYADIDPQAVLHTSLSLGDAAPGVTAVLADIRHPGILLDHPAVRDVIRPGERTAVLLTGTVAGMTAAEARAVVAGFTARLAPGSAVVISCALYTDRALGEKMARLFAAAAQGPEWRNHAISDVESSFDGLLVEEGWPAHVGRWPMLPSGFAPAGQVIGGVGFKPSAPGRDARMHARPVA